MLAHHFGRLLGYIFMGSSMEAIAAQSVFDIHFVRQAIQIGNFGIV